MALGQQIFDRPQHERQRSSEFMADIAEERGFGAIDLSQSCETFPLFLGSAHVLNSRSDLAGDQVIEGAIFRIQSAGRIHSRDQDSDGSTLAARSYRQNYCLREALLGNSERQALNLADGNDLRPTVLDDFGEGPEATLRVCDCQINITRCERVDPFGEPADSLQPGRTIFVVDKIENEKWMSSGFFAKVTATEAQAASVVFCTRALAESSDKVPSLRALITFGVTSVEGRASPPPLPTRRESGCRKKSSKSPR